MRKFLVHVRPVQPFVLASMGPQLYRCGKLSFSNFHLAASSMLQWGRNFIVAEIHQTNIPLTSHMSCFNGAATLSLRKFGQPLCRYCLVCASMGPQLYRCGNSQLEVSRKESQQASMGPQLYRCGNSPFAAAAGLMDLGFNGAATLSLRKSTTDPNTRPLVIKLQWGRNFIVAEMSQRP